MIKFNWVEWSNFLSNGAAPTRINITDHNTNLIRGTNGAGKTTLIDALLYALFNKPLRKVNLPQLVNSVNKKKMIAKVNFTINGVTYEVHRGQKPKVFSVFSDHTGEMVELDSTNDMQKTLEDEILNTNYKTFTQVVVMASMKFANFMDLQPADRRIVVNQMLDLEVLTYMNKLLAERVKEVRLRSSGIENRHNEIRLKIDGVTRLIASASESNDGQVKEIDGMIDDTTAKWKEQDAVMESLRTKNEEHNANKPSVDVDGINAQLQATMTEIGDIRSDARLAQSSYDNDYNTAMFYASNDRCDRCAQPIDGDFKAGMLSDLKCKCDHSKGIVDGAAGLIAEKDKIIAQLNSELSVLQEWDRTLNQLMSEARQVQSNMAMLSNQNNKYMEMKQNLLNKGTDDVGAYHIELEGLNSHMEEIVNLRAEVSEEMELCSICSQMLNDKGLKAKIVKEYLPVINTTINHYLDIMGANYSFMLDEQFNETILSRYRDNFSYGSFSNGEATRINFAIVFMFRKIASLKNTVATNLLIMDEVLDGSMDKQGIDDLMKIISSMYNSNIFVISHREEIVELFDNVITVKKMGNFAEYDGI